MVATDTWEFQYRESESGQWGESMYAAGRRPDRAIPATRKRRGMEPAGYYRYRRAEKGLDEHWTLARWDSSSSG